MQPERNPNEWQRPAEQPSQAPYVANPVATPAQQPPVVTLTPTPPSLEQPPQATSPVAPVPQPIVQAEADEIQEVQPNSELPSDDDKPLHWQATEYVHHERTPIWFVIFAIVVVLFIVVAIFLLQSLTFAILIPVMAAALLVYVHRPPRLLDYTLSHQGLHVNDHLYSFAEFKGFGVIHDGEEYSLMLLPVKRFRPGVSVYFPEEAGEELVDKLGARLPMHELHLDLVDTVIHKLRI